VKHKLLTRPADAGLVSPRFDTATARTRIDAMNLTDEEAREASSPPPRHFRCTARRLTSSWR